MVDLFGKLVLLNLIFEVLQPGYIFYCRAKGKICACYSLESKMTKPLSTIFELFCKTEMYNADIF